MISYYLQGEQTSAVATVRILTYVVRKQLTNWRLNSAIRHPAKTHS